MTYAIAVDEDGGITLPPELLDSIGWNAGTRVCLELSGTSIVCTSMKKNTSPHVAKREA